MASVCQKSARFPTNLKISLALFFTGALLLAAACAPLPPPSSGPLATPSKVITEEGVEFFVWSLKLPGTRQVLKLKEGGALTWMPLNIVDLIRFSGPVTEGFRQADITLVSGEKLRGQLFVGQLVVGHTDLGYWNVPLEQVRALSMGSQY